MPTCGYFHTHAMRAAALGQLGRQEEARKALQDLLTLRPDFAAARQEYGKWFDSEFVERILDGLRKAGLKIAAEPSSPGANLVGIIESNNRHRHES